MKSPVTIYVVHHPECKQAETVATELYSWFRLGYMAGDASAAGLPVYFRRQLQYRDGSWNLVPEIKFDEAQLNVVILLVDQRMVLDEHWRTAALNLATEIHDRRNRPGKQDSILIPGAMHDSFYRTGHLYQRFNPVRLLNMTIERMVATIRRAATETTARMLRAEDSIDPPPINVFLSHAKRDGMQIAQKIRDGVRNFSQLVAWYDANDLPFGAPWESPMVRAAERDTAAMVVTVTDAYPTRSWCRKEATLARTPRPLSKVSPVWKVQPVVAVHRPQTEWVRGIPMLDGVPRIGWDEASPDDLVERIVDRLVLEVLLGNAHRQVAQELIRCEQERGRNQPQSRSHKLCVITWVPDTWTLASLRQQLGRKASSIRRVVYPGYGLTVAEIEELKPAITAFHPETTLVSYEEAW